MGVTAGRLGAFMLALAGTTMVALAQPPEAPAQPPAVAFLIDPQEDPGPYHIGSRDPRSGFFFEVALEARGAAIGQLWLSQHFATVADKDAFRRNPQAYDDLVEQRDDLQGHYALFRPVIDGGRRVNALTTRRLWVHREGQATSTQALLDEVVWRLERDRSHNDPGSDVHRATYVHDLFSQDGQLAMRITKVYTARRGDHSVELSLQIENLSDERMTFAIDQVGPIGLVREDYREDLRRTAFGQVQVANGDRRVAVSLVSVGDLAGDRAPRPDAAIAWIGQTNKFFASMLHVIPRQEGALLTDIPSEFYAVAARPVAPVDEAERLALSGVRLGVERREGGEVVPGIRVEAGTTREIRFDLFAGPKSLRLLTDEGAAGHKPLYDTLGYSATIEFRGCGWCAFDWMSLLMMRLLGWLERTVALGNYGVAIIILVLLVRLVLHPLTKRSQMSMMGMQKLGPEVQKIKEKYADDKNAMNREMMALYKQAGFTPILGCLPMFLQMPIWIGLWTGINATVELRHAAFLPVWLTDLATPDALFSFGRSLWLVGPTFNLLPLLLCLAMYLQQRINPQMSGAAATATTPEARAQQRMMRVLFPAMMLFIFWGAPSGLTLYVMASMFGGVFEQWVIRRHIQKKDQTQQGSEVTVAAPGKSSRQHRPKKPRNPFQR